MSIKNEKLLKISDDIFQEMDPTKEKKKPLEWRRSFNSINFKLKNIKIIKGFNVHERKLILGEIHEPLTLIQPDIKTYLSIRGEIDDEDLIDTIYVGVEDKDQKDIYSFECPKGVKEVTLRSGIPTKAEGSSIPEGLYKGNVFRFNYEPTEDKLIFELPIPANQIDSLIQALSKNEESTIEISAQLHSFTYEVDDFFKEYYHPRDFIIRDSTLCFVSWISLTSNVGKHYIKSSSNLEIEPELNSDSEPYKEVLTVEQLLQKEQIKVLSLYVKPVNNVVKALWFLIILVFIQNFFR